MTRLRKWTAGAAMAAVLASGAAVFAQGPGQGPRRGGPGGPGGFGRFGGPGLGGPALDVPLRALNLTDAQQQQIKDIRDRHRDEARQIGDRLRDAMAAERKAIETEPVNDSLIRSASQQLADVQADAAVTQAHMRSEILAILTAEQRAQLAKLQADRQAREQQARQRGAQQRNRQQ